MRLVDSVFRGGHLSEASLVEAIMTGERPVHLDRCELCADRAVEMGRWLDQVRTAGLEAADEAFPPERLAAQQAQIMRRLEQLDQPARVIAFPSQTKLVRESGGRRVAAGWVAVAAAAGLALGVVGGQISARVGTQPADQIVVAPTTPASGTAPAPVTPAPAVTQPPVPRPEGTPAAPAVTARLEDDIDLTRVPSSVLSAFDESTPRLVAGRIR